MKDHNKKIFLKGILEYSSNLKLATFKDTVESEIRNATEIDSSYEELIYKLLQKECDYKQEQLRKNRIRTANFPYKRYLEELDVNELPADAQNKLPILSTKYLYNFDPNCKQKLEIRRKIRFYRKWSKCYFIW